MKIKLINPIQQLYDPFYGFYNQSEGFQDRYKTLRRISSFMNLGILEALWRIPLPPLSLTTLAALTPADIEIKIEDERVRPINFEEKADLVGITTTSATAAHAYEIALEYRKKGVKVVLGGIHASACPEEALEYCDAVVIGEAEYTWPALIKDFKENKLKRVYQSKELADPRDIPIPRFDLLDPKDYCVWTTHTTRGCPFNCSFCSVTNFFGRTFRQRPIENVVKEVKTLKNMACDMGLGRPCLFFSDDNIFGNREYAKDLFSALIPLKIYWGSQSTINIGNDPELLKLAQESGCILLGVGYESFSKSALKEANKAINRPEKYQEYTRNIRDHGISIVGMFIFGFDSDNRESLTETVDFSLRSNIDIAHYSALEPLPGTPLFKKLKENDQLIVAEWWKKENHKTYTQNKAYVIKHPVLSGDDIFSLNKRFYALGQIFKRLFKSPTIKLWKMLLALNLAHYLAIRINEKRGLNRTR